MGKAYLAYFSDYVLAVGAVGGYPVPVAGAQVTCYPVGAFAQGTLPGGGTVAAPPLATAITDATGRFTFPALPPDDYHLLIAYTPPGGSAVATWRYNVPVASAAVGRMALSGARGACLGGTLGRLAAGLGVTILCLGDDTTVGYNATGTVAGGWVALFAAALAAAYPRATILRADPNGYAVTVDGPIPGWSTATVQVGTGGQTITVVNSGVRGDTVLRALRRFAGLIGSWPAADCLVVALGQAEGLASDTQRYAPPADFAGHLESLVNVARTYTNAELLLCTPHGSTAANLDDYAAAVRGVAARLRADLCDWRGLWLDRYLAGGLNDGYDPWLAAATSHLFPTDAGHAAMATELAGHFAPAGIIPVAGAMPGAGKGYETVRVPYSSGQVGLQGSGWAAHGGYQGAALNSSGGQFEIATNHAGDSATIGGRFVDLAMLCRRWSDCGQVGVSVDGGPSQTVDLYRGYPTSTTDLADANGASAPQDRVILAHGLQDSAHTVVVTLLAGRNAASSGQLLAAGEPGAGTLAAVRVRGGGDRAAGPAAAGHGSGAARGRRLGQPGGGLPGGHDRAGQPAGGGGHQPVVGLLLCGERDHRRRLHPDRGAARRQRGDGRAGVQLAGIRVRASPWGLRLPLE